MWTEDPNNQMNDITNSKYRMGCTYSMVGICMYLYCGMVRHINTWIFQHKCTNLTLNMFQNYTHILQLCHWPLHYSSVLFVMWSNKLIGQNLWLAKRKLLISTKFLCNKNNSLNLILYQIICPTIHHSEWVIITHCWVCTGGITWGIIMGIWIIDTNSTTQL